MRRYEGVFLIMNAVVFYSNTNQSKAIAEYFADKLDFPLTDIENVVKADYKNLVLVFPVYCQNLPDAVKAFLEKSSADNLTAIATYGKICCGNVIYEIQKDYGQNVVAAAYVPTRHSYIDGDTPFRNYENLNAVVEKTKNPSPVNIPKLHKNPLADLYPKVRSRIGLKIKRGTDCDGCNVCGEACPNNAINAGVINNACIRCLKCVTVCPKNALKIKLGLPLRMYLHKKKSDKLIIYV